MLISYSRFQFCASDKAKIKKKSISLILLLKRFFFFHRKVNYLIVL